MTYLLINTMNQIGVDSIGTVVSKHRSVEAASAANGKLQRAVRRANGQNSYLPTTIVGIRGRAARGMHVHPMHVIRGEQ